MNITFNDWSIAKLVAGKKKATSRPKKKGKVGDIFTVPTPYGYMKFKLTSVRQLALSTIALEHYADEGAGTPQEFIQVWENIYDEWTPKKRVWFHEFRKVSE